ncbi:AAA+ ATPase superfamily predicted ATPase [Clostridium algifaecis]|uniref:AAA+ ATPase superfamily predicted ATPase n=1 Tax=Clostridium algifaecis TaxID=1472040 RepID=A0ABS4KUZ7_9CLOT|nr:hypothetical protein [Clostridium algifaecis]MBP2033296.1 AAA+ ATPase superfamily predicted ATPase [Clostridium algifaecis]
MIKVIENALKSMGQRKVLFILGDHLVGKTKLIKEFLKSNYGEENIHKHYIDVGLYIKDRVNKEYLDTYEIYPEEFKSDAEIFFKELVDEKYKDSNIIVFDHMEFLLSEKYTGWIKILDKKAMEENTAVVIVPSEYKDSLPLRAYKYIEV